MLIIKNAIYLPNKKQNSMSIITNKNTKIKNTHKSWIKSQKIISKLHKIIVIISKKKKTFLYTFESIQNSSNSNKWTFFIICKTHLFLNLKDNCQSQALLMKYKV